MAHLEEQAQAFLSDLTDLRRTLHQHPELAGEEYYTAQQIEAELDKLAIPHRRIGETGVLGTILGAGADTGRKIALRADIDALPIEELNEVPYRSLTSGVMHACGHDAHTTCLLGGARLLMQQQDTFGGEIRLIFQPGEEVGKGAFDFIRAGALEGVQRVFGLHTAHEIPAGTVSLTPGLNNAAVDHFRILVHGRAAHVSTPQLGADALYIASQIVVAAQGLVTRRTSPVEATLIGIGRMRAGTTYNAVAEEAELEGTTRTITPEMRQQLREQLTETAQRIAALYGGTAEVIWTGICSALYNDPQVCSEAVAACRPELPGTCFDFVRPFSLGGDNFSEYTLEVPGAYAYLGSGNPDLPGTMNAAHNGNFDIDEGILSTGAALYAAYALWWMQNGK